MDDDYDEYLKNLNNFNNKANKYNYDKEIDDLLNDPDMLEFKNKNNDDSINLSELNSKQGEDVDYELENLTKESKKREEKYIDHNHDIKCEKIIRDNDDEIDKEYYDEKVEIIYHRIDKMKSIGVLMEENELMDHIINFNKKNNYDIDSFEMKKMNIDTEIKNLQTSVEIGVLTIETYKSNLNKQLLYEKDLLKKLVIDEYIKNKNFVKKRIEKRILKLDEEINSEIKQEDEVEEIKSVREEVNKISHKDDIVIKDEILDNTNENKDKKIIDNKLYDKLKFRAEEYKRANDYFIQIQNQKQADDSRNKAIILIKALKQLEEGREIDELSLPNDLTADYICDCSTQDRLKNFKIIGDELTNKKKVIKAELEEKINQIKLLNKREQEKKKPILDELKKKFDNCESIMKKLLELIKEPWTPCPLFTITDQENEVEKINEDIFPNTFSISIGEISYVSNNIHLIMSIQVSDNKEIKQMINKPSGQNSFKFNFNNTLEKSEFKSLFRKTVNLSLIERRGCCFSKDFILGEGIVKLDKLKSSSFLENICDIKSDNFHAKLNISIKLRSPCVDVEYMTVIKKNFEIIKVYPSFKTFTKSQIKVIEDNSNKVIQQSPEKKQITKETIRSKLPDFDPSEFCPEELDDPDYIENLKSLKVIDLKIKEVQGQIDKIEGRAPSNLREKLLKMRVKYKSIENNMSEGIITPDRYIAVLKIQLDHDRKLLSYLESIKQIAKAKQVSVRIPLIITEMDDTIKYLKSNKK